MKVSRVGARFAFKMVRVFRGDLSMLRRHLLATAAASFAAPALVSRASLGQTPRKVKLGSAFTTTTNAMFLMPNLLKDEGIDPESSRSHVWSSGCRRSPRAVDIGNGGLSATMQSRPRVSRAVLANGCDGGWMLVAKPSITRFNDLAGKKVAVQNGSIGWSPQLEARARRPDRQGRDGLPRQPGHAGAALPRRRGRDLLFEPYAALAELNGCGKKLWVPYDSPMGKTNLGFVASEKLIKEDPGADQNDGEGACRRQPGRWRPTARWPSRPRSSSSR